RRTCVDKVIVLGYSWGGATVTDVVKDVSLTKNYKFRLVYTIDPVIKARFILPDFSKNYRALTYAEQWVNWYQTSDTRRIPGLQISGKPVDGADNHFVGVQDFKNQQAFVAGKDQQWANDYWRGLGTDTINLRGWAAQLDPAWGHTGMIVYPPM